MLEWLWRLVSGEPGPQQHRCEEFTRWLSYSDTCVIVADGRGAKLPEEAQYELARNWQQRECTICGLVQQRPIPFPDLEDIDDDNE